MKIKKVFGIFVTGMALVSGTAAKADPGVFGQPTELDGSLDIRRSTTEQFDPIRGQSVADRPRPDFDATPLSVGSFEFFPAMNFTGYYDSNIFAQNGNEQSDFVWKFNPAFSLLSNWGKNAVGLTGFGDFDMYTVNTGQNYNSGALQTEGRWDVANQTWLAGSTSYQRVTELRGNPSTPGSEEGPSQYNLYSANAEAYRGVGQLKTKLDYGISQYNYDSLELIGGGIQSQGERDRVQQTIEGEVDYDYTENLQPFLRAGYNTRQYTVDNLHSSDGQNYDVGAKMDFGGIVTASAYVGWLRQNYFNFGDDIGALDFGGDVLWNVTGLTSIEFKTSRSIEETEIGTASSYIASGGDVTVTHELRRDVLLDAHMGYTGLDYQEVFRHDDYYDVGAGVRYFINRNLFSDFTYDFERRGTDATDQNFTRNVVLTRVGVQY